MYKSVEHRVLANGKPEARISIAVFYNPEIRDNLYGPLPELITPETPAVYGEFTYDDYITRFFNKELDGKSLPNHYRIWTLQKAYTYVTLCLFVCLLFIINVCANFL